MIPLFLHHREIIINTGSAESYSMPREKILDGDLDGGAGVEGRRRAEERDEENETPEKEKTGKTGKPKEKSRFNRLKFGKDSNADIFDTSKE